MSTASRNSTGCCLISSVSNNGLHAYPELSMQETRTAGMAAERLRAAGCDVTPGVGQTGVIALIVASRAWLAVQGSR